MGEKSQSKKVTNRMSKEELPSIDDEVTNDLPSVEDFITEENAEELPSVEEYIEKEEVVETVEEEVGQTTDLTEIVRLINDVRKDIPDIPEVKYYDAELEKLCEIVDQVRSEIPEVKSYDSDIEAICGEIDLVKENIQDLPEVKYYDEQVTLIEDRIDTLQTELTNLPEVKYYDKEIEAICGAIDGVKAQIPKWVSEVNEVPDFSWIGKNFSVIDDDLIKVGDTIDSLQTKVDFHLNELSEDIDKKYFESSVEVTTLDEKVNTRINEEKDKIWKELRSSSLRIWEYHKEFKDDDKKLKKQVLGEYNSLKQNIKKELKEINYTSVKTDELLLKYFTELKGEISELPEVKYYDEDLKHVRSEIKSLYKLVEDIKETNKILKEEQKLLSETNVPLGGDPPNTKNLDPLTPLDKNFVTLDQLQKHYKSFVERVQYQLASIGGGGETRLQYLDDIVGIATNLNSYDGMVLQVDVNGPAGKKFKFAPSGGADGVWSSNSVGVHTTKNVGVGTTARSNFALYVGGDQYVDGNVTVGGTVTYEDVKNVDSIGIVTARTGIKVLDGGINVVGVSTISTGIGTVNIGVGNTTLLVQGDARVTGILTIGTGSITLDPNNREITGIDEIVVGSGASLSLAPLFASAGKFVVDYSKLTLKGYNSNNEGTYERQSSPFVLGTAPTLSGSARFQFYSGFYYFLHESDNSKIIIFNIVTGNWDAVHSNGSNFSSPSNGQSINPITNYSFVTPVRDFFDDTGKAYPGSGRGIEYKTTVTGQTQSIGVATATSLNVAGIATVGTAFYMPQYTTTARDAATFDEGAMIYNTTSKKMEFYDGTSWQSLPGMTLGLTVALDG